MCGKQLHKCIISITKREVVLALKTSFTQLHFVEMPVPSQASEQSCIHVYRHVPSQTSEQSCIHVYRPVPSQASEQSCIHVYRPVPSQASEQSYMHVYRGIDLSSFSTIFIVNFGALLMA